MKERATSPKCCTSASSISATISARRCPSRTTPARSSPGRACPAPAAAVAATPAARWARDMLHKLAMMAAASTERWVMVTECSCRHHTRSSSGGRGRAELGVNERVRPRGARRGRGGKWRRGGGGGAGRGPNKSEITRTRRGAGGEREREREKSLTHVLSQDSRDLKQKNVVVVFVRACLMRYGIVGVRARVCDMCVRACVAVVMCVCVVAVEVCVICLDYHTPSCPKQVLWTGTTRRRQASKISTPANCPRNSARALPLPVTPSPTYSPPTARYVNLISSKPNPTPSNAISCRQRSVSLVTPNPPLPTTTPQGLAVPQSSKRY